MLGNFHAFYHLIILQKNIFLKNNIRNTIRVSKNLDPDLVPNCLQMISTDRTSTQTVKVGMFLGKDLY